MKLLVFTEGTVLMHKSAHGLSRKEVVEQSRKEGIQREEAALPPVLPPGRWKR